MSKTKMSLVRERTETSGDVAKLVKLVLSDDGSRILSKYGLSWLSGQWLKIEEGEPYPRQCFIAITGIEVREFAQVWSMSCDLVVVDKSI